MELEVVHFQDKVAGLGWKIINNGFPLRANYFCLGKLLAS